MRTLISIALAAPLAAALLSGCATVSDPTPVASTRSRECKVVAVHSTRESMYGDIHRGQPAEDSLAQAEGAAGLGKAQQPGGPRALREPAGIGKVEQAMRDC